MGEGIILKMQGRVYWITGLAGSGKTTIGRALYHTLKKQMPAIVFLDGDELREVFDNDLGYAREERLKVAMRYSKLCNLLSVQGITVVCCTISMFHSIRQWNRQNIPDYCEVYIKVSQETLVRRNQKGLFSNYSQGKIKNIIGLDLEAELPAEPDLVIENEGSFSIEEVVMKILNLSL